MTNYRQLLLHAAVAFTCAALTVLVLRWANGELPQPVKPQPRMPLAASTLVQIDMPYGLLPSLEIGNTAFGMENGRIGVAPEAFDDLATVFTGPQPDAWPEVPKYEPPTRSRGQARYSGW